MPAIHRPCLQWFESSHKQKLNLGLWINQDYLNSNQIVTKKQCLQLFYLPVISLVKGFE